MFYDTRSYRIERAKGSSYLGRLIPGQGAYVTRIFNGAPTDHRFLSKLTDPATPICNRIARPMEAYDAGSPNRQDSATWERFHVRH